MDEQAVGEILAEVDGGCSHCASMLVAKFIKRFPELDKEKLIEATADTGEWEIDHFERMVERELDDLKGIDGT